MGGLPAILFSRTQLMVGMVCLRHPAIGELRAQQRSGLWRAKNNQRTTATLSGERCAPWRLGRQTTPRFRVLRSRTVCLLAMRLSLPPGPQGVKDVEGAGCGEGHRHDGLWRAQRMDSAVRESHWVCRRPRQRSCMATHNQTSTCVRRDGPRAIRLWRHLALIWSDLYRRQAAHGMFNSPLVPLASRR